MSWTSKRLRTLGLVALLLAAVPLALSAGVAAQEVYREFYGKIDKIDGKKVIVDNRQGDKVTFNKLDDTAVEGEGRTKWDELKKGDWVTVSWKFVDKPRKAYKVTVKPPKEEAGEEVE
jgi:hypothetical protein